MMRKTPARRCLMTILVAVSVAVAQQKEPDGLALFQRDNIAGRMTSTQIADAQRLSTEWKAKK
jgi:hypothetical protein